MSIMVVFGYPDGRLANPTFRAYKRARRVSRSRGLDVTVELRPFGELPAVVDVLLGATEVRETIVAPAALAPAQLERWLDEMVERGALRHAPPPPRTIAVHRGVEPVAGRARVADAG